MEPWKKYEQGPWQAYSEPVEQPGMLSRAGNFLKESIMDVPQAAVGALETGASVLSGIGAEPVAGIAGIAATPFVGAENAADVVNRVREWGTYIPKSERGQQNLQNIGSIVEPIGRELQATEQMLGEGAMNLTGSPAAAAAATALPTALMEGMGYAAIKPALKTGRQLMKPTVDEVFIDKTAEKQKIIDLVKKNADPAQQKVFEEAAEKAQSFDQSADVSRAGKTVRGGRIVSEKPAKELIKQGMDPGTVALIQSSEKADRSAMRKALEILKAGRANKTYAVANRPGDVAGDMIKERYDAVKRINKRAATEVNKAAEGLTGRPVDVSGAYGDFWEGLNDLGVSIRRGKSGRLEGVYDNSEFAQSKGTQKIINDFLARSESGTMDGLDAHRLKRVIDGAVEYGRKSSKDPILSKAENLLKGLRSSINDRLKSISPEYRAANEKFADTRSAMDSFEQAAGPSFNPLSENAGKQLVNTARSLMSNNQKRIPAMDAINDLQQAAFKYGVELDGDVLKQAAFMADLEKLFGSAAPTSFGGQIETFATRAGERVLTGDSRGAIVDMAKEGIKKVRGINEENLIKALEELLGE